MARALVTGAGGFIAGHLVRALKHRGDWVRGVDRRLPEFADSAADEFLVLDLRDQEAVERALALDGRRFDLVYHLAAEMGGMGFIHSADCEVMRDSVLIDVNVINAVAAAGVPRYFFSSSVCVYRDMAPGEGELTEADAYPAFPDNEYGWEKLYAERTALAFARRYGFEARIARFQNCYGPQGAWTGGREKAPAAICRKVAEATDGGTIEVWGDGSAIRSFIYVDDMVAAILALVMSDLEGPVNIGTSEYVTVDQLAETAVRASAKRLGIRHVDGPRGVLSRNFSHARIESLGWRPTVSLAEGIGRTYAWIDDQVRSKVGSATPVGE